MRNASRIGALAAAVLMVTGCTAPPRIAPPPPAVAVAAPVGAAAPAPAWRDIAEAWNRNLAGLTEVFIKHDVALRWREADGDAPGGTRERRENGNGVLIFRAPLDTALSIDTFGKTFLWAGSDIQDYWLFTDLHKSGRLFVGQHTLAEPPRANRPLDLNAPASDHRTHGNNARLPLPVPPQAVPYLLGLKPLDPQTPPAAVDLVPARGDRPAGLLFDVPGVPVRMLLHADTLRPLRVDLLDPTGHSTLIATHTGTLTVKGSRFRLPARVDVNPVGEPSAMRLDLRSANTFGSRIKDKQFDLGYLVDRFNPAEIVELADPG